MSSACALIVGASSGIGRELARALAAEGCDLLLVAREEEDLNAVAADCIIRFDVRAWVCALDIGGDTAADVLGEFIEKTAQRVDYAFITAGISSPDDREIPGGELLGPLVDVNFVGPGRILLKVAASAKRWKLATLVVCSSIAAGVPRRRNFIYAAAKSGLEVMSCGLRHSLAGQGVLLQIYILGYVDTALAFGQNLLFPMSSAKSVADRMVRDKARDIGRRYYPSYWAFITWLLRLLPWAVYRRLRF